MDASTFLEQQRKHRTNFVLRKNDRELGQSFVELALIIPVLLILLAGVIDIGRFFMCYMELRDAAQEGANYASLVGNKLDGITNHVKTLSTYPIDLAHDADVNVATEAKTSCTLNGTQYATSVKVTVTYKFVVTAPFIGMFFNDQKIDMNVTATSSVLNPSC